MSYYTDRKEALKQLTNKINVLTPWEGKNIRKLGDKKIAELKEVIESVHAGSVDVFGGKGNIVDLSDIRKEKETLVRDLGIVKQFIGDADVIEFNRLLLAAAKVEKRIVDRYGRINTSRAERYGVIHATIKWLHGREDRH